MKRALFLDKEPATVRVPLQMQNLDTQEGMTAVNLQFLQHNAQARVTVTQDQKRSWRHGDRCPDEEGQRK